MDEAHRRAEQGEPAGLLVVADHQSAGRGRVGKKWTAEKGAGLWFTLVERPSSADSLNVLSLRVGLSIARVLEALSGWRTLVKWPNDVFLEGAPGGQGVPYGQGVGPGKVAGVLVEARWREQRPDWVAIGVGINVGQPGAELGSAALGGNVSRYDLLEALIPHLRRAATGSGELSPQELADWHARDLAIGRRVVAPVIGAVVGVNQHGALLVDAGGADGQSVIRSGSMEFAEFDNT